MSWGMIIKNVFVSRRTKDRIESDIIELKDNIEYYRQKLLILASSSPIDITSGSDTIPWCDYVLTEVNELVDSLIDDAFDLRILNIAKDDLNEVEDEQ